MQRNKTIDIYKGIGIILVVLAHIISRENINSFIYLFHMPLFFFVSGMTMYYSYKQDIKFKDYLVKKVKNILLPYVIFSLIWFVYWYIIERKIRSQMDISATGNLINIFTARVDMGLYSPNVVMWFLPCLFMSEILFYFLMKCKKGKTIITIISLVIGYILNRKGIVLPWTIETALISISFIYFGYLYQKNKEKMNKTNIKTIINIISILGLIMCMLFKQKTNMLAHQYGNLILFLIGAYAGIFSFIELSDIINKYTTNIKNILCFLGRNSITIMLWHEPIKRFVLKIFSIVVHTDLDIIRQSIIYSCISTAIVIVIILPIIFIINKYLPFMIGKKKKSRYAKLGEKNEEKKSCNINN